MSMEMTWLQFQLSTNNQNGRHLETNFLKNVFKNSLETWYIYKVFGVWESITIVRETENEAASFILVLSILINRSYFQLFALKPGIYRVTASAEGYLSACMVFFVV